MKKTTWTFDHKKAKGHTLQQQLYNQLRKQILGGQIKPDEKLPSSRHLAEQLGLGRNTVVYTYEQLTAEGYIETRIGAGTFVCSATPDSFLKTQTAKPQALPPTQETTKPLYSGMPALDKFPFETWNRISNRAWRRTDHSLLQQGTPMGYLPLRKNIATYLGTSRNVTCTAEQIMIITGLQQGLYYIAKSLLKPTQPILLEDPGYGGLRAAANATGHPVVNVPVDTGGVKVPAAKNGLLVTSPSRQYPFGYTMPHKRRMALLEWAHKTDSLILEDDYDSEFRYSGKPLNSMQGLDGGQKVIYGGTFSKTIFPAFRLGYLVLPERLIDPILNFRKAVDSFPGMSNQLSLHAFMAAGEFEKHVRRLRKVHHRRQVSFIQHFTQHLGHVFTLSPSNSGLHLLAMPAISGINGDENWAQKAQKAGLGAVPLSGSFDSASKQHGLLLGFADIPESDHENRIKKFANYLSL